MKSKKVLATILSVVMLVASLPCIVMADNEGPSVDIPDTETQVVQELTEGVTTEIARFDPGETKVFSFTPSSNGRYGFMCADGFALSVSVTDQYGTAIAPAETERINENIIIYLTLDAGMKYLFAVSEFDSEDSYSDNVQLLIGKSPKTLHLGTTYDFGEIGTRKEITFTPSESGVYTFTLTAPRTISSRLFLGGYDYAWNRNYSSDPSIFIFAELTAGVTYPLTLDRNDYSGDYGICVPVKITVSKNLPLLETGPNSVTVKANNQDTYFQFVPQEDGVYQIYTKGDHSTEFSMDGFSMEDHHYGEGNNFKKGVNLKAGEVYFPTIRQSGSSEEVIDVYIEKVSEITGPETGYSVDSGKAVYYSFTPSKTGFYNVSSNVTTVEVRSTKYGVGGEGDTGVQYFQKGENYLITIKNTGAGNIGFAWLYVKEITNTISVGSTSIDNSPFETHVYALFTPEASGKYTFNIPVGNARFMLTGVTEGQVGYFYDYTEEGITGGCALTAGETYLLDVNLNYCDSSVTTVPVHITKDTLPVLGMDDNTVYVQREGDTYYSFTAPSSGTYEFSYYMRDTYNSVSVLNGTANGTGTLSLTSDYYHATIITLEEGKEYTVGMPSAWDYAEPTETTLYIKKLAELEEGDNQVSRPFAESSSLFFAEFTPKKTGIYTFTNGDTSFYSLNVKNYEPGENFLKEIDSAYYIDNRSHFLLEAGKTYMLEMTVWNNKNTPTPVLVTKDPALKVGTNSVHIPSPDDTNSEYSYFSFTAPEEGHYIFKFENADLAGTAIHAGLYTKTSNTFETAGYFYNGVYTVGCDLRKGETYRLRVKLDPNANGEDLDIAIISAFFPESKLDGYTLSLDGTIAVNLYMTLADKVAESDTARMNVTLPNGATKAYKMSDATPVTVNGKTYHVFRVPVAAKEMTAEIKAQIVDGEFEGTEYTFTVQDYAKFILDHPNNEPEFAAAVPLVKALLNYGAYSQTFFGYKTDALANSILKDEDKVLPTINPNSLPGYNSSLTSMPQGVTFKSVSLSLETETELNLTFTNTTGKALSFTTDNRNVKLKVTTSGDQTKLKISGIPAHKINEGINLKVFLEGDSNTYYVSYSPIYYCRNQIQRPLTATRTQSLKDLMAAFYLYNQAARNYIDN